MIDFNKEELRTIAQLSVLNIDERETELFVHQIKTILAYVEQLQQVKISAQVEQVRNVNMMRDDESYKKDTSAILALAPEREASYFVVPNILEEK
jgi:aspartyl/glutamyl-tRNA(Asn/Gln) amidotransferase C subunit